MPIAVTCASCSASFSVKDEYAGKRAKCPQCKEPLTVPAAAAPPPPPVAPPPPAAPVVAARPLAKPVVASRPKPAADDEAGQPVSPKRERGASNDAEEDETPRAQKRRQSDGEDGEKSKRRRRDDEDDDTPRGKRRRRDDDDEPKKKGSALPLILGILGGVLVLCCGGPTLVWFVWIKPGLENAAKTLDSWASEAKQGRADRDAFKDQFQQVKAGMTKKQVDDLLGPNSAKALEHDVGRVTFGLPDWPQADDRWKPKAKLGHVLLWDKSGDGVLVAFSADPNAGGTVVGVAGNIGFSATEPVKLAAEQTGDVNNPVATLTVEELTTQFAKYRDKWVTLSGAFNAVDTLDPFAVTLAAPPGFTLTVSPPPGGRFPLANPQVQPRESLTFTGKVGGDSVAVRLKDAKFVRRSGGGTPPVNPPSTPGSPVVTTADAMIQAFIKDLDSPEKLYYGKQVKVTGKVVDVTRNDVFFGGTAANAFQHYVSVRMAGQTTIKKGDTVTVVGRYFGYATDATNGVRTISLTDGKQEGASPSDPTGALTVADVLKDHEKYKGKQVTVRGRLKLILQDVNRTSGGVVFDGGEGKLTVQAEFPPGKWRSDFLQGFDTVELKGTVVGLVGTPGSGQFVQLQDCDLLKRTTNDGKDVPLPPVTPPAKPTAVTAADLAAEFAKDMNAAAKKYTDKTLTVSGTVEKVSPTGLRVTLKGVAAEGNKKAYVVDVTFTAAAIRDEAKKLKEGDVVRLTGKYSQFRPSSATAPNTVLLTNGVVEK